MVGNALFRNINVIEETNHKYLSIINLLDLGEIFRLFLSPCTLQGVSIERRGLRLHLWTIPPLLAKTRHICFKRYSYSISPLFSDIIYPFKQ